MITLLAKSRLRYHRSRTILTIIAVTLTTTLLMALGTSAIGLLDFNRQQASETSNVHATLMQLTRQQVDMLQHHVDVEALEISEIAATVEYGKMNGFLTCSSEIKSGIRYGVGNLIRGRRPEAANEICGPAAFFERMGVQPDIGEKVTISFRPQGEGRIQTRQFVITGLVSQRDASDAGISDSRIVYSASVSEKLIDEWIPPDDRSYNAAIRVYGETELNYDEISRKIEGVAKDIGCGEQDTRLNQEYLYTMTDPGTETIQIVGGIALLIVVFSGLVIYSIYYVSVITDVQEIGKLKALGASRRQVKGLLLREGLFVSGISIPVGLLLGFFIPYFLLPVVMEKGAENTVTAFSVERISMFSLPVLLLVAGVSLLTVYLSLLKPMRMASRISPVEAIRYQESSRGGKLRKGNSHVDVLRLSWANLTRNKRRTVVTMITMGLSCVLLMSLAGVLNSMRADDIASRELEESDFKLSLDYALNDQEYPENNLENLQQQDLLSDGLVEQIEAMDGVERVRRVYEIPAGSQYASELFEKGQHITVSPLTEEKAETYEQDVKRGVLDYGEMSASQGALFTSDVFWDDYGLKLGDEIPLTLYDGDRKIPVVIRIQASVDDGGAATLLIPQKTWDRLKLERNSTTQLYIDVEQDRYEEVKTAMQGIEDSSQFFQLYSRDEETKIGAMAVNLIKYPMYAILLIIAVIGFLNLLNTMIISIVTRKRELGMLQAIGLSDRQLTRMLAGEGMVFTAGTLLASVTLGTVFGYLIFLWAKSSHFMSVTAYHYPALETAGLALLLILGQLGITLFVGRRVRRESLIDRIRSGE